MLNSQGGTAARIVFEAVFKAADSRTQPAPAHRARTALKAAAVSAAAIAVFAAFIAAQTKHARAGDLHTRSIGAAVKGEAMMASRTIAAERTRLPAELQTMLDQVERRCGAILSVGGYRQGATFPCRRAGRCTSYHALNKAVDFTIRDRACAIRLLSSTWRGGFLVYSGSRHLHADLGPRVRAKLIFRTSVSARRRGGGT